MDALATVGRDTPPSQSFITGIPTDVATSDRVVLNVGGTRFETCVSTLTAHPDTLLGAMFAARSRGLTKPDSKGEYFFDRNPLIFASILEYYRTGVLVKPVGVTDAQFYTELEYFNVPMDGGRHRVYMWGRGDLGQLGNGDRSSTVVPVPVSSLDDVPVTQISLGTAHNAVLTCSGAVLTWGHGVGGRLGHGDEDDQLVPTIVAGLSTVKIAHVVCGELHTAALCENGWLYTWGCGKNGELGHGDRRNVTVPTLVESLQSSAVPLTAVACGSFHTVALSRAGEVYSWGLGEDGRLGHGDQADQLAPKRVESLVGSRIVQVACGGHHTAALTDDGRVLSWGFDDDGRLGHGSPGHHFLPKLIDALVGRPVVDISCGCWHSAVRCADGSVYSWGSCKSGQLGNGHKVSIPVPKIVLQGTSGSDRPLGPNSVVKLCCGTAHTAALTSCGTLLTWGKHDDGRLGYETDTDQMCPKPVTAVTGLRIQQVECRINTAIITGPPPPTHTLK